MYLAMSRPCGLKICGIMDREGVDLCLRNHADVLGFVTEYPVDVPWNLKREEADALLRYVREKTDSQDPALSGVKTCIVTGGNPDQVIRLALELRPDTVQLHGRETVEETAVIADALRKEGISVIRSVPAGPEGQERVRRYLDETAVDALLLDSRDAGNAAAGGITLIAALPAGIVRCTNPAAFSGGSDSEDDESLRARILASYRRLPNGANAAYYEQAALSLPEVAAAKAVGRSRGIGTVDVYVASQAGVPSQELLGRLRDQLAEQREIAVDLRVLAPAEHPIDLSAKVKPREGCTASEVIARCERALRDYFTGARLGEPVLTAHLTALLYSVEGVENCALVSPSADIAVSQTELPTLRSISVTEMA